MDVTYKSLCYQQYISFLPTFLKWIRKNFFAVLLIFLSVSLHYLITQQTHTCAYLEINRKSIRNLINKAYISLHSYMNWE